MSQVDERSPRLGLGRVRVHVNGCRPPEGEVSAEAPTTAQPPLDAPETPAIPLQKLFRWREMRGRVAPPEARSSLPLSMKPGSVSRSSSARSNRHATRERPRFDTRQSRQGPQMSSRIQTVQGSQVSANSTHGVLRLLADYDLHVSGEHEPDQEQHNAALAQEDPSTEEARAAEREGEEQVTQVENPAWWPTNHNNVPPYRPVNYNLDRSQRPAGQNTFEFVFINGMLTGVCAVSGTSKLWRATFGRIAPKIFHYKVGGEW